MTQEISQSYRADVDGLRAIAVLSVIVFHIKQQLAPGGFVGVDVFFVISGFLITRSIRQDLERKKFSLLSFYKRRVQRIIPAMTVVVLLTTIASQHFLLPADASTEAKSALWAAFSGANIYFWQFQDSGYFAIDSAQSPLLHLWSLGVEEQFYLVYPLLLCALSSLRRVSSMCLVLSSVALISFAGGQYLLHDHASFAYYGLPTRAGELILGALVALITAQRSKLQLRRYQSEFLAWLGALLLGASIFGLSEASGFPGFSAALPTVGTALLIYAGCQGSTTVSWALSRKPLVWVGLVSYSAYLWHWPLLAFFRYGYGEVDLMIGSSIFVLTMLLAWLSYRFVEQPARRSHASTISIFLKQLVVPVVVVSVVALLIVKSSGYGLRLYLGDFKARVAAMKADERAPSKYSYVCQQTIASKDDLYSKKCEVGPKDAKPAKALLWGDSNAAHYVGAIGAFAKAGHFKFYNLEHGACPPIFDDPAPFRNEKLADECRRSAELVRTRLDDFSIIMLSSSWSDYLSEGLDFIDVFSNTARQIAQSGKLVILIGKAPVFGDYDRLCTRKALLFPGLQCSEGVTPLLEKIEDANQRLRALAAQTLGIEYYDFNDALCPKGRCSPYGPQSYPLYYNKSHLATGGSWLLGEQILAKGGLPFPFTLIAEESRRSE